MAGRFQEWLLHGWGMIRRDTHVPDLEPGCLSYPHSIQWRANVESLPLGTKPLTLNSEVSLRPQLEETWDSMQSLRPKVIALSNPSLTISAEVWGSRTKIKPTTSVEKSSFLPLWIPIGQQERKLPLDNQWLNLKGGKWQYVSNKVMVFTLLEGNLQDEGSWSDTVPASPSSASTEPGLVGQCSLDVRLPPWAWLSSCKAALWK